MGNKLKIVNKKLKNEKVKDKVNIIGRKNLFVCCFSSSQNCPFFKKHHFFSSLLLAGSLAMT
jgi:hypothetical protein